ncbi:hypothetical protein [Mycobacterium paraense]|uniref:hypothetical protein n=1 Tax=Mycobacterium paraense TaxID=767916 RepID=UPI001F4ED586|nr:hypothetical protein [Mycobacterium paraense]
MRFRATDLAAGAAVLLCLAAGVGCERSTGGTAVRTSGAAPSTTSAAPTLADPAEPVPGVKITLPDHIPPNAVVCFPPPPASGTMAVASVPDPVAPVITLPLPDGWNPARGSGDVALTAPGPAGMSVRVTITPTDLDAGGAFLRYAADLRARWPGVAVSVAPAEFCGYSSQLLGGTVAGPGGVAFADRITHVWTNTRSFLVVIHVGGPAGAPGFDAAKATAMQQFAVVIP